VLPEINQNVRASRYQLERLNFQKSIRTYVLPEMEGKKDEGWCCFDGEKRRFGSFRFRFRIPLILLSTPDCLIAAKTYPKLD
jgi:hypothetical protein